jgi:hypothetical protein
MVSSFVAIITCKANFKENFEDQSSDSIRKKIVYPLCSFKKEKKPRLINFRQLRQGDVHADRQGSGITPGGGHRLRIDNTSGK